MEGGGGATLAVTGGWVGGSGGWVVAVEAGQEGGRSTMNPSLSVSRRRMITPSQVVSITNKGDW